MGDSMPDEAPKAIICDANVVEEFERKLQEMRPSRPTA